MGRTSAKRGVRRTGGGPDLPCADGKPRKRMAGGHHIVIVYRDAPAYAEGRARFDAYAADELHARAGIEELVVSAHDILDGIARSIT